jgi:quinol monooxygenase YgiN
MSFQLATNEFRKGAIMTHVMIRHRINDYEAWKTEFDNFVEVRKSSGERSFQILQRQEEPTNLYVLFEWDNIDNARKFLESSALKSAMKKAGVIEAPEIHFLTEAYKGAH